MAYRLISFTRAASPTTITKAPPTRQLSSTVSHAPPPEFNLKSYLTSKRHLINAALALALPLPLRHPTTTLHATMRYSLITTGGKRVCPILTLASCALVCRGQDSAAMPLACAAEMIHAMSLIHDDLPCMDAADLRRGQPSAHRAFGEAPAVLAGDALLALAFRHAAAGTAGVPADRVLRAVAELAAAAGDMAAGQAADLASEGKEDVDIGMLEYIHEHKTARLVEAAAACGAIVGGGGEEEVEAVRRYGRWVGLMFQVVDDVLDATATSEELGKTAGKDVAAGKATYPRVLGIDGAREFARTLLRKAEEELTSFAGDPQRVAPLLHLARYIAGRRK